VPYKVLWIENDYLDALHEHLAQHQFEIVRAFRVSQAEELIEQMSGLLDLILLDLMMDVEAPDITRGYTAENTNEGYRTGLQFYRKNHDRIKALDIPVLVYTILGNQMDVRDEFKGLGLPEENYLDKRRTANVNLVRDQIDRVLRGRPPKSARHVQPGEGA
jgi:CheY-like chemotaxis protein